MSNQPVDERTALAQAIIAHQDAVDLEDVQENWGMWGPCADHAKDQASDFIAMFDALTALRASK